MDWWEMFSATAPGAVTAFERVLAAGGTVTLVILFARDVILTKGQHLRRVADIVAGWEKLVEDMRASFERERAALLAHHERELQEKDARLGDTRESLNGYKEATRIERARADSATASVADMQSTQEDVLHVLQSLDRALPKPHEGGSQ